MSALDKPDPANAGLFVQKLLDDEEVARLEAMSDEEVERELVEAGGRVPSAEELVAKAQARAASRPMTRDIRVKRSKQTRALLLFAATLGVVAVVATMVAMRATLFAWREPPNIVADDAGSALIVAEARAETLRRDAFAACGRSHWAVCRAKLDEAATLDPAGENDARVREARRAVDEALRLPGPNVPRNDKP